MIGNLIGKELREHWLAFAIAAGLSSLGLGLVVFASIVNGEAGNILEALRGFLLTFGIPVALVICNRLVVREYQGKTQLFLESLPLTRGRMIVVKFALGLAMMAGFVAIVLAVLLPLVMRRQAITALFVGIVTARAMAFTFFVYSFFFVTGMLGRYRMAIFAAILLGLVMLSGSTTMELGRFGPLALMDRTFPYERSIVPTEHLFVTLGLGAAFSVLAFALAMAREGSAAAMLAEKMSHREKVFVTAVLLGMVFLFGMFDKQPRKRPFDLEDAIAIQSDRATVKFEPGWDQDPVAADALATRIHGELAAAAEYLGLEHPLPVFITSRRDLDANRYELGDLVNGEGLLARANFSAPGFDRDRFLMWLLRQYLIAVTKGRVELESKHWVLDGFAPFWMRRHHTADAPASLLADKPLALRALYGTRGKHGSAAFALQKTVLSGDDLRNWMSFRERAGDGVAMGVAWSGLDVLARRQGAGRMRTFLRAVLASPVPADARSLWFERQHPIEAQLEQAAGVAAGTFLKLWREELDNARVTLANDLARLPRVDGELWFENLSPDTRMAKYRVALDPQPRQSRITLLHADLEGWDTAVTPQKLHRENIDAALTASGELAGTWPRGGRLYWTFSLEIADLGCDVISGWNRREID